VLAAVAMVGQRKAAPEEDGSAFEDHLESLHGGLSFAV
jgi:hypothetical protein